jgi:hypothetical protein
MKQDFKISKELFEAVFGAKIMILIIVGRKNSKFIQYAYGYTGVHTLSVNDFFFMCKEWAALKNLSLISGRYGTTDEYFCEISEPLDEDTMNILYADSEQQAVFDACEWILNTEIK